jgi:2-hydroxycyclohexanecarboxyl-CoA dehydrogenase
MSPTALITGSTRGIGAAIASRLARDGYEVIVNGRDEASVKRKAMEIGGRALAFDVSDPRAVAEAIKPLNSLAVLVNNAGYEDEFAYFTDTTPERWHRMLAVNLLGAMSCVHAALPGMQRERQGRIVTVGSEAGRIGSHGNAAYAAAKGGVIAFTKSIARENARYGITCNHVAPGPIDTPQLHERPRQSIETITGMTLLKRVGTADEVAAAVAFLASEEASYITGETLGVSGGMGLGG